MKEKNERKKWLTLTNIMALIMVILYILDRWVIPIPENYKGFSWEDAWKESAKTMYGENYEQELSPVELEALNLGKTIGGNSGGLITNTLAIINTNINPNGNSIYRYFTVAFTHAHHLHLITNVIAFLIIGNYIEKKLGALPMLGLFFLTDILGVPLTNMISSTADAQLIAGASGGIFGLFGIGLAMCSLNKENFKDFSKAKKIYLIIYGIVPTYILSFGWTTVVHNISLSIGFLLGIILNCVFPKFKEIVYEKKKEEIKSEA